MAYTPKKPRSHSKRSRKKDDKLTVMDWVKIVLFVVGAAALVSVFIFLRADIGNVADDYGNQASELNAGKEYSKSQFNKQFEYANEQKLEEAKKDIGNSSSPGIVNGTLTAKEDGELITDTTLNPSGLPLYDGWTMNIDELKEVANDIGIDSSSIKSWDLNIQQFWETDDFKDNPGLYGLGDFTNSKTGSKNMISVGGVSGYYKGKTTSIPTPKGNVSTYDGRVLFAVGGRIYTDPDLLTEEIMNKVNDPCGLTRTSPEGATRVYNNCYKVTYNGFENMIHDYSNCVPGNNGWKGVYFDILFDDGTVLAAIMADGKGVHMGGDSRGSWSDDVLMQGYGHVRFNRNDPNVVGYQSLLELYGSGCKNNGLDINLDNKKIVGIRTYKVNGVIGNTFMNWFTLLKSK